MLLFTCYSGPRYTSLLVCAQAAALTIVLHVLIAHVVLGGEVGIAIAVTRGISQGAAVAATRVHACEEMDGLADGKHSYEGFGVVVKCSTMDCNRQARGKAQEAYLRAR